MSQHSEVLASVPVSEIKRIFELQRRHRKTLRHSSAEQRKKKLKKLKEAIIARIDEINTALHVDLRKPLMGAEHFEIKSVLHEIDDALTNLQDWMTPVQVETQAYFGEGDAAHIMYEPRGVCLLFGPWNFPFTLTLGPLTQIIAAGNSAIVKPNEMQPATSAVLAEIIKDVFDEAEVAVLEGGVPLANALLELPVDHIFFTGSPAVGKHIMAAAAKNLATVTLELGGKCPAIVDETYNLQDAAGKVVGARFSNAGQLCLSVDHVWVPESKQAEFVEIVKAMIQGMFYVDGELVRERLSRIVNERNLARVKSYLDEAVAQGANIAFGGEIDEQDLTFYPTVLTNVSLDSRIMQEEIFGPILPILTYKDIDEVTTQIDKTGKPLAMYVFSDNEAFVDEVLMNTSSGGVTVNHVLMHYQERNLPFGGVNQSGVGRCHGIHGFKELSNARSVFTHKAS